MPNLQSNVHAKIYRPGAWLGPLAVLLATCLTPCMHGQSGPAVAAAGPITSASKNDPVLHPRGTPTLLIGPGDLVDITVFETPDLSSKQRVDATGSVDLPVAGSTPIAGLAPEAAARAIEAKLKSAQIMLHPRVTVFVADYATQSVSVLGEVKTPGNYLLLGPHSLYGALSAAGGTTERAGSLITVTHVSDPQNPETIHVEAPSYSDLERATTVRNGDIVYVSHTDSVYVLGDVTHPGEFPIGMGRQLSVMNAVALAQGTTPNAANQKAVILRKTETGVHSIPVDLTLVAQNKAPDPGLRPDDIVIIPHDRKRAFMDATLPGLTGALAGSAVAALVLMLNR